MGRAFEPPAAGEGAMAEERRTRVYVACFESHREEYELENIEASEGSFQIVVEAFDRDDALARCRARLDGLADSSEPPGPIKVYLNALIEPSAEDLGRGVLFNRVDVDDEGRVTMYSLPADPSPQMIPKIWRKTACSRTSSSKAPISKRAFSSFMFGGAPYQKVPWPKSDRARPRLGLV
jgi:hypothetical protein